MPYAATPPWERFQRHVVHDGISTCWHWSGCTNPHYGSFMLNTKRGQNKRVLAHRYSYQMLVGAIPDGLELDHLCRNKLCVNPAHLRPVTKRENILAIPREIRAKFGKKTHCRNGHEFTPENTLLRPDVRGVWRECRACRKATERRARAKKGMAPRNWISDADKAEMKRLAVNGVRNADIARQFNRSPGVVFRAIHGRHRSKGQ